MEVRIKVEGLKELDKALRGLGTELGAKTLRSALRDAAQPMLDDMLVNAPVDGGFLKSKTKIRTSLNRKGVVNKKFDNKDVAIARIGTFQVPYVVQVEFGTPNRGIPANPYIRNATRKADESVRVFKQRLLHRIKLAIKRKARKKAK